MKRKGLFNSLHTQLPITYAGIALLTTSLIGIVLYLTIWNYYTGLEKRYLDSNVHGTANNITRIAENTDITVGKSLADYEDVFQNQVKVTAFLIQSRVRILDINHNMIADSGSPSKSWNITVPRPQSTENQPPPQPNDTGDDQSSFSLEPSEEKPPQNGTDNPPAYSFQANPNMFGYMLQDTSNEYDSRSSVVVETPFFDKNDAILGYVELSESPEYGRKIINNVLRGWGIASLIGVVVSTFFGFVASNSLTKPLVNLEAVAAEMKDGNYKIRSPINKPTELASLSDTFNQMAAHIQHNIETLRQFVSDAAHEIRTPLTSLRADLNLALSEKTLKKTRPMIQRSLEQVERLDRLSRDLLDLSRLESKNEKTIPKKINLTNLLLEISEIHASAAEQAEVDFQVQLPAEAVYIHGDEQQLQRAVSNLLSNAVKFTPSNGEVTLSLIPESQFALILVEDNGIGIPLDEREKLFNRFHRGKNTQNYPGSGLGLAISKIIIEKHGGTIGILPDKEKTIFFISLPLNLQRIKKSSNSKSAKPA